MKKKWKLAGIVLGVIACLIGGKVYWDGLQTRVNIAEVDKKTAKEVQAEIDKSYAKETSQFTINEYEDYKEKELIQEVHNMAHQKVHAEQKWGHSEITEDKVLKLFEVIKGRKFKAENTKVMLLTILEPWTMGDFSNAVSAHNRIWGYQGGTVGKATRLLSPSEELKYIEKNFR